MIISHKKKFVFLRTGKTASSSIEIYLSQFCSKRDTITPLGTFASEDEDKFKIKRGLPGAQNYILKKKSFGIKNFLNLNFYNKVHVNSHDSIDKVLKTEIGNEIKDYYFFCFIRNPFDWIVRSFWWHIYIKNNRNINWINSLNKKELNKIFKKFLDEDSYDYFKKQEDIITNKNVDINIYRYEELEENIKKIKKRLNVKKEKILLKNIKFKKLKIKRKILIDRENEKKILQNGEFFFNRYYQNTNLPLKYKS